MDYKLEDKGKSTIAIPLIDPSIKGGKTSVKATRHKLSFVDKQENSVDTTLFFFSYRGRSYVCAFNHASHLKKEALFNTIQDSFTIE